MGFTSGVLTGAYNTGGPPVILYASARKWPADRFKGNLQTYFFMIGVFVCLSHAVSGHITPAVWRNLLVALPALILGQVIGVRICGYFSPALFRRLVLILLMVLGIQLLL